MTLKVVTGGSVSAAVADFVPQLVADNVASRIAAKDFTLWGKDAEAESSIRLGWVTSAHDSAPLVDGILALRDEFAAKGVNRFVLCGMGGSSLAPEESPLPLVLSSSFSTRQTPTRSVQRLRAT